MTALDFAKAFYVQAQTVGAGTGLDPFSLRKATVDG